MVDLVPCPFCGQSDFLVERLDSASSMVICQGMVSEHSACLARGPVGVQDDDGEDQPGKAAAIREWNRRASSPAKSAQPEQQPVAVPEGFVLMPSNLTAKNGAKAALTGEFTIQHEATCSACYFDAADEDCEVCGGEVNYTACITVPWDTIKEIYVAAVEACGSPVAQTELAARVAELETQSSRQREAHRKTWRQLEQAQAELAALKAGGPAHD